MIYTSYTIQNQPYFIFLTAGNDNLMSKGGTKDTHTQKAEEN